MAGPLHLATEHKSAIRDPANVVNRASQRVRLPLVAVDADETLLNYFKTMDAFLETQRQVMEAYLGQARASSDESHHSLKLTDHPSSSLRLRSRRTSLRLRPKKVEAR